MKNKIFAIALSILMAACLTACKGTAPDSQPGSNSQSISSSASASSQNLELLYGRVSEVAGNELTAARRGRGYQRTGKHRRRSGGCSHGSRHGGW